MASVERANLSGRLASGLGRLRDALPVTGGSAADAKIIIKISEIIFTVILAILLARLALTVFAPLPLPKGDVVASLATASPAAQALPVKNPFSVNDTLVAEAVVQETFEETSLDLKLTGVWTDGDGLGSAAVELPDGKQKRFNVGDQLINGVTLRNVYPDHIIIERSGVRESLRFDNKLERKSEAPPPQRQATVATATSGELAAILRLAPGNDQFGEPVVKIYASRDRQAFARLGLREGDMLRSIDGKGVPSNPAQLAALIAQLQRKSSATIEIERGGETIPIVITSNQ